MVKKAFTINQFRTKEEINSYKELLEKGIYQGIEIFYPYELSKDNYDTYTASLKELMVYNPEVVLHLPFGKKNNLLSSDGAFVLERLKNAIDYGITFGAKKFTLHLGYVNDDRTKDINNIINILKDLVNHSKDAYIMIENMPSIIELGYSPKEIKYIISKVNSPQLKFILDTGHANVSTFTIKDYLIELSDLLMHVHLNDNNGLRDEHARIGNGNIDFVSFFKDNKDYNELYCSEILYKTKDDLVMYASDIDKSYNS